MFSRSCVAQATCLLESPPDEGAGEQVVSHHLVNFQIFNVFLLYSLVSVKATEVELVFHLAVAQCLLARSLMPPVAGVWQ